MVDQLRECWDRDIADSMGAEIFLSFVSETESGVCWVGGM